MLLRRSSKAPSATRTHQLIGGDWGVRSQALIGCVLDPEDRGAALVARRHARYLSIAALLFGTCSGIGAFAAAPGGRVKAANIHRPAPLSNAKNSIAVKHDPSPKKPTLAPNASTGKLDYASIFKDSLDLRSTKSTTIAPTTKVNGELKDFHFIVREEGRNDPDPCAGVNDFDRSRPLKLGEYRIMCKIYPDEQPLGHFSPVIAPKKK
jgi:hypothetical protein